MLLKLLILVWDERSYYILLNMAAFVFALLAALGAGQARESQKLKWLIPLTIGLGIEPSARIIGVGVEFFSNAPRLPRWLFTGEHALYFAGQAFIIYGMFTLWREVNGEARARKLARQRQVPAESWPPAINRGE